VINALQIQCPNPPPSANAGANTTSNEGSAESFSGTATGGLSPYTYHWDFGDGATADGTLAPTHVYSAAGTYTAALTVTDAFGQSAQSTLVSTVKDVAPTLNIGGPYQGTAQSPVSFSAVATEPNPTEQAGLAYSWNFGDGTAATGAAPSHVFAQDGIYNVVATVVNANGLSTQAATQVDIFPSVSAGLDPTVDMGTTLTFQGTAVGSSSLTYHWDFGDGGTADGTLTPSYTYYTPGTYTATLTVTDTSFGFVSTGQLPITVDSVPPSVSLVNQFQGAIQVPITLAASATDLNPAYQAALTYTWDLGDGSSGTGATTTHTYTQTGIYTATLTVAAPDGSSTQATTIVDVFPSSTGSAASYYFDFGTSSSPLASGSTRVTSSTTYTSTQGYGWLSGGIQDRDRTLPSVPLRAFNFTPDGTFAVDVPNGMYSVTVQSGDYSYSHDLEGVFLQGTQVDTITTARNQFAKGTYQITVSTGQLDLRLKDLGGRTPTV
jgi:PKD repeat protein